MASTAAAVKTTTEACPGCGAVTPLAPHGPTHRYMLSSPGCWARFGEVLAREYQDAALMHIHGLTVDAYALQHPGAPGPQTIQSVNVHLASLYAYFHRNWPLERLADVRRRIVSAGDELTWLAPPAQPYLVTVNDVWSARTDELHVTTVRRWASATLAHWREHHHRVTHLLDRI